MEIFCQKITIRLNNNACLSMIVLKTVFRFKSVFVMILKILTTHSIYKIQATN